MNFHFKLNVDYIKELFSYHSNKKLPEKKKEKSYILVGLEKNSRDKKALNNWFQKKK